MRTQTIKRMQVIENGRLMLKWAVIESGQGRILATYSYLSDAQNEWPDAVTVR